MAKRRFYLYGVVSGEEVQKLPLNGNRDSNGAEKSTLLGLQEAKVYAVSSNGLVGLISDTDRFKLRPEKTFLQPHHAVINRIANLTNVILPASFGQIAPCQDHVRRMLKLNHRKLEIYLAKFRDKTEMVLKVFWEAENVYEYLVQTHSELRTFRDKLYSAPGGPTKLEQINLGGAYKTIRDRERERIEAKAEEIVRPRCEDVKIKKPKKEEMVVNMACLVGRDKAGQKRFEEGVLELKKELKDDYRYEIKGPWAPYNFIRVTLKGVS